MPTNGTSVSVPVPPVRDGKLLPAVGWLLGPDLLSKLKEIALSALYAQRVDPRVWMTANPIDVRGQETDGAFWFDYMADTGDAQWSMYTLATVALQPMLTVRDGSGAEVDLPRGKFLFVGGDTAYHISDEHQLRDRFQGPFNWAYDQIGAREEGDGRPFIIGIPGNHDYYDLLMGFEKQFRAGGTKNGLDLRAFAREQLASYVAVELPFGWHLWGLDTENGEIDERQDAFFAQYKDRADKLILCTSKPTTVFRRKCDDKKLLETFTKLGLDTVFLRDGKFRGGRCRLDLAGDVHHYARYWGPTAVGDSSNYASVVSGLGGAFHHPTGTDLSGKDGQNGAADIRRTAIYPSSEDSNREIARRLFLPRPRDADHFFRGSWLWIFGGILAAVAFAGATRNPDVCPQLHTCAVAPAGGTEWGFLRSLGLLGWLVVGVLGLWGASKVKKKIRARNPNSLWIDVVSAALPVLLLLLFWAAIRLVAGVPTLNVVWNNALAVVVLMYLGLIQVLAFMGGKLHAPRHRVGFAVLGLVHGWLQLATPVLLVSSGPTIATLSCAALLVLIAHGTYWAVRKGKPAPAIGLAAFVAGAAAVTSLPWWPPVATGHPYCWALACAAFVPAFFIVWMHRRFQRRRKIKGYPRRVRPLLVGCVASGLAFAALWLLRERVPAHHAAMSGAFLVGALASNGWLRWYLGVSHLFNGHNNEVGGACRIDRFRQFIRFRITETELTGYVIAVEDSEDTEYRYFAPNPTVNARVVDEFRIAP